MVDLFLNEKLSDAYLTIIDAAARIEEPFPIHRQILASKSEFFSKMFDFPGSNLEMLNGKPLFSLDIISAGSIQNCLNIIELCYKNLQELDNLHISSLFYDIHLLEYFQIKIGKIYRYNLGEAKFTLSKRKKLSIARCSFNFKYKIDQLVLLELTFSMIMPKSLHSGINLQIHEEYANAFRILIDFRRFVDPEYDEYLQKNGPYYYFFVIGNNDLIRRIFKVLADNRAFVEEDRETSEALVFIEKNFGWMGWNFSNLELVDE